MFANAVTANFDGVQNVAIEPKSLSITYNTMQHTGLIGFACIIGIMFPMMYRGISPIVLTIIVAVLTTIVTLGLLGGYSSKTVSAILGTAIGVVIAAVAAMAFGKVAGITGYNVSDIEALNYV